MKILFCVYFLIITVNNLFGSILEVKRSNSLSAFDYLDNNIIIDFTNNQVIAV